jgi:hypothetical protein
MSSLCLVLLSAPARDVPAQAVNGEACTPLVDDAQTPMVIILSDMALLVIKSRRTSVTDSSSAVSSSDIRTQER